MIVAFTEDEQFKKFLKTNKIEYFCTKESDSFEDMQILDLVVKKTCAAYGVPVEKVFTKTRKREIIFARSVIRKFLKDKTTWILATIGFHTGGQDHATVLNSIKTFNELYETDKKFKEKYELLKSVIDVRIPDKKTLNSPISTILLGIIDKIENEFKNKSNDCIVEYLESLLLSEESDSYL